MVVVVVVVMMMVVVMMIKTTIIVGRGSMHSITMRKAFTCEVTAQPRGGTLDI